LFAHDRVCAADVKSMKRGDTSAEAAIDKQLGILDHPWSINQLRVNSRLKQPPQVQPGPPPYQQQPEGVQDRGSIAAPGPP